MGFAQILRWDKSLTERQTSGLSIIHSSAEHLLMLINDVLDLSRIEAGKLELRPVRFDLLKALMAVADTVRVKAQQKSLLFVFDPAADLPLTAQADDTRLRQVLLNLLSNAVKFTDRGEVRFEARVLSRDPPRARLRFQVADTGVGIEADQVGRLFQPFEQVGDIQRRNDGTGLGLSISAQLVRLMGSSLELSSTPRVGSRFWFDLWLPVSAESLPVVPVTARITGYEGRRRKVLVVDDVQVNRVMLAEMLGAVGFEVVEAGNGRQAVDAVQASSPDLVIMDIVMPVMDGLAAMRRLRELAASRTVPIIAASASTMPDDREMSLAAGANVFVTKPIDHRGLLHHMGTLLGLHWLRAVQGPPQSDSGASPAAA
jgi:CheY-like chemotaxis protein